MLSNKNDGNAYVEVVTLLSKTDAKEIALRIWMHTASEFQLHVNVCVYSTEV
jgi:hypothetical protein